MEKEKPKILNQIFPRATNTIDDFSDQEVSSRSGVSLKIGRRTLRLPDTWTTVGIFFTVTAVEAGLDLLTLPLRSVRRL